MDRLDNPIGSFGTSFFGRVSLFDLIPLEELQRLQDTLSEIGGVASMIADSDGNLLTMPSNASAVFPKRGQTNRGDMQCMQQMRALCDLVRRAPKSLVRRNDAAGVLQGIVPIGTPRIHLANWWIGRGCDTEVQSPPTAPENRPPSVASGGLPFENMTLSKGSPPVFETVISWIELFVRRLCELGWRQLGWAPRTDAETWGNPDPVVSQGAIERQERSRIDDLLRDNTRLQLATMEQMVVREQSDRRLRLLTAQNRLLQEALSDRHERTLCNVCLSEAQEITRSPFGFMVAQVRHQWQLLAVSPGGPAGFLKQRTDGGQPFAMSGFWKQLIKTGAAQKMQGPVNQTHWYALPDDFPAISALLAVALPLHLGVPGFIALANSDQGYTHLDQTDVQALTRAFVEALLRKRFEKERHQQAVMALRNANQLPDGAPHSDRLIGMADRSRFEGRLAMEWRRGRRERSPVAVIIGEIDCFDNYTITYGRSKGDETLAVLARSISGVLKRPMDMAARYGRAAFAAMLPNTDLNGAVAVAKQIKKAVRALRIEHNASTVTGYDCVTLSYGVAVKVPDDGGPMTTALMEKAERALGQAKARGGNRIVAVSAPLTPKNG